MFKFIQLSFLFLGCTLFFAQSYTISGKVEDFHDKTPLDKAIVRIGHLQTTTNAKGIFVLKNIEKGLQTILVSHPDCDDYSKELMVNDHFFLKIQLEHHVSEIESVTIHRKHKDNGAMVVATLQNKEIQRNTTENLGNLLSNISGVSALKTGNNIAKPMINGLYGDRIGIISNGVNLADQEWGVEHAPNVDANGFEHIDVVKGASALKYGMNFVGGVVVLEPEIYPKKDTLKGRVSVNGISNGKGLAMNINVVKTWANHWAIKTRGAYQKLGDLATPDYHLMNTGKELNSFGFVLQKNSFMQGYSMDYSFIRQKLGIFRSSDLGNLNDFYAAVNADKPIYERSFSYDIDNPHQAIDHHVAKFSAFKRLEDLGKFTAEYSFQYNNRKEYDIRRGDLYGIPAMELSLFTHQFSLNHLLEREHWSIESGVQYQYQYNYSPTSTQAKRLIPNYHQDNIGVYSVGKYTLSPLLKVELGLRGEYQKYRVFAWWDADEWKENYQSDFSEFYQETLGNRIYTKPTLDYSVLGFNIGFNGKIIPFLQWKINYSNTGRIPNIAELFAGGLHHSAAMIEKGDMRLSPENFHQFQSNFEMNLNALSGLKLIVNPYFSSVKNFITQVPTGIQNTIRGVFPVWSYRQVDAQLWGITTDVDWQLKPWLKWNSKFAYLQGQDTTNNQPLILMMPTQWTNDLELSFPWKKFFIRIEHQWVGHQSRFPVYNPTVSIFENGIEVDRVLDLSTPPPAYQLWNLYAEVQLYKSLLFSVKIQNLGDVSYRNYLNRMRYFASEMGRNITLGVQYKF
ncbi:MAG: TonB-dependent receptor [Bacteroidetes bacterium]|nr:TonB-dependent receptor [Bacteroidota bacterium]